MALRVWIDTEVPQRVRPGRGSALFVSGCCASEDGRIRSLLLSLDGARPEPVLAQGMPRRDGPARLYGAADPTPLIGAARTAAARDSGFWGVVPLDPTRAGETTSLRLLATLEGGGRAEYALAAIEAEGADGAVRAAADSPSVAICMSTFDPSIELFRRQLETIRAQTFDDWICLISDDDSRRELAEEIEGAVAGDDRFRIVRGPHLGLYHGFERAMSLRPPGSRFVALADQHGSWHPRKLERLVSELERGALLAYSDMRVVDSEGSVLSERLEQWRRRPPSADSVLLAGPVPGSAAALRAELADLALPFPRQVGPRFRHDHWLALLAAMCGGVSCVDERLHDHLVPAGAARQAGRASGPFGWRESYFADYCRTLVLGRSALLRCGEPIGGRASSSVAALVGPGAKRRAIALGRRSLSLRSKREGAREPAARLLRAMAWPGAVRRITRWRPAARRLFDAGLPPAVRDAVALRPEAPLQTAELRRRLEPLELELSEREPVRTNVLVPAIDPGGTFGGYLGVYHLVRRLAEQGRRPRLVALAGDPTALAADWRTQIERQGGLSGLFEAVDVAFRGSAGRLPAHPTDTFVASSWETAHVAHRALSELRRERFLYLIQDYEPSFYPGGSWHALAAESYEPPHFALFSTELLRDYFRRHRIGVFAPGEEDGEAASASFQSAITPVPAPSAGDLRAREGQRLLFYARLEEYAPRNLFDLGVIALGELAEEGAFGPGWQFTGVGTMAGAQRVKLGSEHTLELTSRQSADRYTDLLRKHDLGLSLMYSPHPSLVPIEMAAAGMLVVTNTYENKTAAALAEISPNLIGVEPTTDGIKAGLREAVAGVGDAERRAGGAAVSWSSDWAESFDDALMGRVGAFLDGC